MSAPPQDGRPGPKAAFTVTELLVVIAVLAVLVATGLPALCRTKVPTQLAQCMNNCRQIAQACMLYRADSNDAYPFGQRARGAGALDATSWPMRLLGYLGGYHNVQPTVYLCPSETAIASGWTFQLNYQGNRMMLSDTDSRDTPVRGAQVRKPAMYWLFMEKGPADFDNLSPGGLANPILASWNLPPGARGYRRHSGGLTAAAADGHVDWLRMPAYQPGRPAPQNFMELGDCLNTLDPPSTWRDNGPCRIKLYCRYNQQAGF